MGSKAAWLILALALPASPALAGSWQDMQRPSPCDHVIPTGLPLPRQAVVNGTVNGTVLIAVPNPTWRDKPIALVGRDEPVTVLQECGWTLRVRNVRGVEGWITTVMMREERLAYETAKNRSPQTEADCALLLLDPVVVARCKAKIVAERAHADEVRNGPYYGGDELRRLVVGNTVKVELTDVKTSFFYFSPEGELFLLRGTASDIRYRTRYALASDVIAFTGKQLPDVRLRKTPRGIVWSKANGDEGRAEVLPGDPAGAVTEVSKWMPNPIAPAVPKGADVIAGPKLVRIPTKPDGDSDLKPDAVLT